MHIFLHSCQFLFIHKVILLVSRFLYTLRVIWWPHASNIIKDCFKTYNLTFTNIRKEYLIQWFSCKTKCLFIIGVKNPITYNNYSIKKIYRESINCTKVTFSLMSFRISNHPFFVYSNYILGAVHLCDAIFFHITISKINSIPESFCL